MNARQHLQALARGERVAEPLFAPLIYGACAQIEALPVAEMAGDATRLGKGLTETRGVLGTSVVYTSVPAAAEAEALGAGIDSSAWPPQVTHAAGADVLDTDEAEAIDGTARLQASLELTRRLAATADPEQGFIAGLTGPATLADQLMPDSQGDDREDLFDYVGGFLTALVRAFGEAGAHAILLQESLPVPADDDGRSLWEDALAPIVNVARFYKIPVLLGFVGTVGPASDHWPDGVVPCVPDDDAGDFAGRPHGLMLSPDPATWRLPEGDAAILLSAGEVPADTRMAALKDAVGRL